VKNIPKPREMSNFNTFPNKAMIHEPQKNEWIKVTRCKKKERFTTSCNAKMKAVDQQNKPVSKSKNKGQLLTHVTRGFTRNFLFQKPSELTSIPSTQSHEDKVTQGIT
jgi:hypothetical protein